VIISTGYRVKSQRGTQFRIWANKILKEYLLKGYAINNRIDLLEKKVNSLEIKNNEFDLVINTKLPLIKAFSTTDKFLMPIPLFLNL